MSTMLLKDWATSGVLGFSLLRVIGGCGVGFSRLCVGRCTCCCCCVWLVVAVCVLILCRASLLCAVAAYGVAAVCGWWWLCFRLFVPFQSGVRGCCLGCC